jgi:hypothetical protein
MLAFLLQVLVRMHWAGINGGCETFRARGEFAFAGNRAYDSPAHEATQAGSAARVQVLESLRASSTSLWLSCCFACEDLRCCGFPSHQMLADIHLGT